MMALMPRLVCGQQMSPSRGAGSQDKNGKQRRHRQANQFCDRNAAQDSCAARTYLTELGCNVDILLDSFENAAVLLEQDAIGAAAAAGDGGRGQIATGCEVEVEALHDDRSRSRAAHSQARSKVS